ncbi:hypothetical protein GWI33_000877 [Rhynchophorus ferrugineus]|uniref:Uncharacterized protein n=1 Tax=Rhynchophorus ferrugineus TaxID=354439 RepID=A0A834IQZ2_RHYFE|nr:hypothetical protein GWI33_000877 [Rhynchophorus ferrugineus]
MDNVKSTELYSEIITGKRGRAPVGKGPFRRKSIDPPPARRKLVTSVRTRRRATSMIAGIVRVLLELRLAPKKKSAREVSVQFPVRVNFKCRHSTYNGERAQNGLIKGDVGETEACAGIEVYGLVECVCECFRNIKNQLFTTLNLNVIAGKQFESVEISRPAEEIREHALEADS